MDTEIKIVELELEDDPLKPSDLRMGGVIETKDGTTYMVLIIGGRFELSEEGEPVLWPEQYSAVVGEHVEGADEDHPIYGTFYNLKLADDSEEGFPLFSEKEERDDISEEYKEKLRNEPIKVIEHGERTLLQNLLFSVHSHPMEGLGIIYHEIDLERVCAHMHKVINEELGKIGEPGESETAQWARLWHLQGADQVFSEMKAFFEHKV